MEVIRCKTYEEMSVVAAKIVEEEVAKKKDAVLGFATGSTPEGLYAQLSADCKAGKVDFSQVTTINLDEYCGLPADHPQSYRYFMNEKLFNHINVDKARTFLPNGDVEDFAAEAERYEKLIADENVELCKAYGVKGAPTLVITDGEAFESHYSVPEIKKYLASL